MAMMPAMSPAMPDATGLAPPGPPPIPSAVEKRLMLADHYDRETARTLELASFAHEAGLKSTFDNLTNLAQRQRTYAKTARARAKLQGILQERAAQDSGVPRYAYGTRFHPGGQAIVGEQGPEMVNMPRGAQVRPNPRTSVGDWRHRMSAGGVPAAPGRVPAAPGWAERGDLLAGNPNYRLSINAPLGASGAFSGNQLLQSIQRYAVGAGAYDPLGSEQAAGMERDAILGGLGARQAQAGMTADLYSNGDPAFRAYLRGQATANTQSEAAQAYREAAAKQAAGGQDFARNAYFGQLGSITRKDPKEPNPLAAVGGQLVGSGIGAFFGGPAGAEVGGKVGKKIGGG